MMILQTLMNLYSNLTKLKNVTHYVTILFIKIPSPAVNCFRI